MKLLWSICVAFSLTDGLIVPIKNPKAPTIRLNGWFDGLGGGSGEDTMNKQVKSPSEIEDDKDPIEKLFNFFFGDVEENPQGLQVRDGGVWGDR